MCMPKPQTLICNCFKDNVIVVIFVIELILQRHQENFPHLVHVIQVNEHP